MVEGGSFFGFVLGLAEDEFAFLLDPSLEGEQVELFDQLMVFEEY